jgi:hypothetical protein
MDRQWREFTEGCLKLGMGAVLAAVNQDDAALGW